MSGSRPTWTSGTAWGMIGLFSICSCANQGAPSGGLQDLTGPQVVGTFPDTFAVVEAFDDEIRIGFDERISESGVQGPLDDAVIISPESGEVRVRHSSRALRVTMVGGFQPDQVYRVTVQPVVQDLFRNVMVDAFEFIFSTGAEMTPTVLAGSIVDRITGAAGGRRTGHGSHRAPAGRGEIRRRVGPDSRGYHRFEWRLRVPVCPLRPIRDHRVHGPEPQRGARRYRADRDR